MAQLLLKHVLPRGGQARRVAGMLTQWQRTPLHDEAAAAALRRRIEHGWFLREEALPLLRRQLGRLRASGFEVGRATTTVALAKLFEMQMPEAARALLAELTGAGVVPHGPHYALLLGACAAAAPEPRLDLYGEVLAELDAQGLRATAALEDSGGGGGGVCDLPLRYLRKTGRVAAAREVLRVSEGAGLSAASAVHQRILLARSGEEVRGVLDGLCDGYFAVDDHKGMCFAAALEYCAAHADTALAVEVVDERAPRAMRGQLVRAHLQAAAKAYAACGEFVRLKGVFVRAVAAFADDAELRHATMLGLGDNGTASAVLLCEQLLRDSVADPRRPAEPALHAALQRAYRLRGAALAGEGAAAAVDAAAASEAAVLRLRSVAVLRRCREDDAAAATGAEAPFRVLDEAFEAAEEGEVRRLTSSVFTLKDCDAVMAVRLRTSPPRAWAAYRKARRRMEEEALVLRQGNKRGAGGVSEREVVLQCLLTALRVVAAACVVVRDNRDLSHLVRPGEEAGSLPALNELLLEARGLHGKVASCAAAADDSSPYVACGRLAAVYSAAGEYKALCGLLRSVEKRVAEAEQARVRTSGGGAPAGGAARVTDELLEVALRAAEHEAVPTHVAKGLTHAVTRLKHLKMLAKKRRVAAAAGSGQRRGRGDRPVVKTRVARARREEEPRVSKQQDATSAR